MNALVANLDESTSAHKWQCGWMMNCRSREDILLYDSMHLGDALG